MLPMHGVRLLDEYAREHQADYAAMLLPSIGMVMPSPSQGSTSITGSVREAWALFRARGRRMPPGTTWRPGPPGIPEDVDVKTCSFLLARLYHGERPILRQAIHPVERITQPAGVRQVPVEYD